MSAAAPVPPGWRLFARYAYAPNARGYCGPAEGARLEEVARGGGEGVDVPALARRFSGAWPYHLLIAELAGIDDPLDPRVGRAYWTGSPLTASIDARRLGEALIERFAAQAGSYWAHLKPDLLDEITPTHAFHVLAIYPWSRLLATGRPEPLDVLDSCRIRAAEVLEIRGDHLAVSARQLTWDGRRLALSDPREETVGWWPDPDPEADPKPGDTVAVHWRHACDRLSPEDHRELERWTEIQVEATNVRLARSAPGVR